MDQFKLLEIIDAVLSYKEPLMKRLGQGFQSIEDQEKSKEGLLRRLRDPLSSVSSSDADFIVRQMPVIEAFGEAVRCNNEDYNGYNDSINEYVSSLFKAADRLGLGLPRYVSMHQVDINQITTCIRILVVLKERWSLPVFKWPEFPAISAIPPAKVVETSENHVMVFIGQFLLNLHSMLRGREGAQDIARSVVELLNGHGWVLEADHRIVCSVYDELRCELDGDRAGMLMGDLEEVRSVAGSSYSSFSVKLNGDDLTNAPKAKLGAFKFEPIYLQPQLLKGLFDVGLGLCPVLILSCHFYSSFFARLG